MRQTILLFNKIILLVNRLFINHVYFKVLDLMTNTSMRLLTLFDVDDKHQWCDTRFDNRVFIRFNDIQSCKDHISIHVINPEADDVHFFFPKTQIKLIMNWPPELNDTSKYIYYCEKPTTSDITEIRERYGRQAKIFSVEDLDFEIGHVEVTLLRSLAKKEPDESLQRDKIVSLAIQKLECLRHNLNQMMMAKTGEQPTERH